MVPLPERAPSRQPLPVRGMSIRGTPLDPNDARLPLPHGGVWSGRVWPDQATSGGAGGVKIKRPATRIPTIICFGDSHTQGQLGSNYVALLQERFRGQFRVVNCGVNGQVLESIRQRVEPTLEAHGEDVVGVIIMGGTNDCLANLNPSSRALIRCYNPFLPDLPSLSDYPRILEEIVAAVYAHCSPFLHIMVMTPPLLGEDPRAPENESVDQICDAIREMVRKFTHTARSGGGQGGQEGRRERRASSSVSRLQEDSRVESVNADGSSIAPAAATTPEETQQQVQGQGQEHRRRRRRHSHHHHHHHHHGPRHRRLHFVDWNRRMRKHLDEIYGERPRKRMEPRFLAMCFNTSVAVVGGALTQSYDAVSDARGFALLVDGVHMNGRAVRLMVGLLERWVEDLQEELDRAQLSQQLGHLRLTPEAAPAPASVIAVRRRLQQAQEETAPEPRQVVMEPLRLTKTGSNHKRSVSAAGSIDGEDEAAEAAEDGTEQQPVAVTA